MPLVAREIVKLFKKAGYEVAKGGGKGSHIKLVKSGRPPAIVPNHGELKKGLERSLIKRLKQEGML